MPVQLHLDFAKIKGKIKPMHAVGQPPYPYMSDAYMHYLTEAHVPFSRLHDVGGWFGGNLFVDIPNLFRDFDADENDPASYDFACTDELLRALDVAKVKPIFRLGVTIENFAKFKTYRIDPPKDYDKWARVCEHVVRHYNEGWANGFTYGIVYWEIWNEPEDGPNNEMWLGTDVDYFRLYEVAAKHLKACFGNTIKVGGFASCNMIGLLDTPEKFGLSGVRPRDSSYRHYFSAYAEKFFDYIKEHGAPIDFFSWHSYADVEDICLISDAIRGMLALHGYAGLETQLNEWNNAYQYEYRGTSYASSRAAAMMLAMQDHPTDILCYYDARIDVSCFGGMFNPLDCKPLALYYAFKAFGELYALGNQATCAYDSGATDRKLFVQAAVSGDGSRRALMIANVGDDTAVDTGLADGEMEGYLIDKEHHMTYLGKMPSLFPVERYQTLLLKSLS